ncbi:hypothetical protein HDU98_011972 [Podochytrium sp. JEL0797]|nr:hypothetical protein HDU98_011972 [Podochytrium sp. JEL0797]
MAPAQKTKRQVAALDTVLFNGKELVSAFIAKIESVFVVPVLEPDQRFHATWTHAGIIVDKNVLPLPCLEEGKLYIFESVLSGKIMEYEYTKIMCVDHDISKKGFFIGPQIRPLVDVVEEVGADVAVFQLSDLEHERLLVKDIVATRKAMLEFYEAHKDWGYPLNPLPQFAAASVDLYSAVARLRKSTESMLKSIPGTETLLQPNKEIFCSEMVAKIYDEALKVHGFCEDKKQTNMKFKHYTEYTPLDLEVMEALKGPVYLKLGDKVLFDLEADKNGRQVSAVDHDLQVQNFPFLRIPNEHWEPVRDGTLPAQAIASGYLSDGKPIYISRAVVGKALNIGYHCDDYMITAWEGGQLKITYDHEILSVKRGTQLEWVQSGKFLLGAVPSKALVGGCDSNGIPYYIARIRIVDSGSLSLGTLAIGPVSSSLGGAKFVVNGKEVTFTGDYEVLCQKTHFLERFIYGLGTDHYIVLLLAVAIYFAGVYQVHLWVIDFMLGTRTH